MGAALKNQENIALVDTSGDADQKSLLDALNRVQAVIEFSLDGTILNANENFLKAIGYSLLEIKGNHHSMFCEKAYAAGAEYALFWKNLNSGAVHAGEFKRLGKGGREIWINASYNPVFNE
ncbi:MAG: PAS domain S-box protein, partial [Proteobacteria bacterium]